jgi:hypothetical protein
MIVKKSIIQNQNLKTKLKKLNLAKKGSGRKITNPKQCTSKKRKKTKELVYIPELQKERFRLITTVKIWEQEKIKKLPRSCAWGQ